MTKCHHSTILRLKKKYQETKQLVNKPIPGRPRKLTPRHERIIIRKIMKNECTTATDIQKSLKI